MSNRGNTKCLEIFYHVVETADFEARLNNAFDVLFEQVEDGAENSYPQFVANNTLTPMNN